MDTVTTQIAKPEETDFEQSLLNFRKATNFTQNL